MQQPLVKPFFRVLVIAYYFPPMGLSGVQRITKFVKYLPEYGWQPTVLTVEPGAYFAFDETMLQEVQPAGIEIIRTKSFDPTRLFGGKKQVKMPEQHSRRVIDRINRALFVPDNKIGWKKHAVRVGKKLLQEQEFDVILSSSPPEAGHLIGVELSRWSGMPLVTDFREEWVDNPRLPSRAHRRKHFKLERQVVRTASFVTTINRQMKEALLLRHFSPKEYDDVRVLSHGFDPEDFAQAPKLQRDDDRLRFVYSGIFHGTRQPDVFLEGLARFFQAHPAWREKTEALFVGLLSDRVLKKVDALGLSDVVFTTGYLPHRDAVAELLAADVLWTTLGRHAGVERFSTGKIYEYIGSRKPIFALVPEGVERETVERYGAAYIAEPDDPEAVARTMYAIAEDWRHGALPVPDETFVEQHDRRRLTGELARMLNQLIVVE